MATLLKPPPPSPNKSPIESVLELTRLADVDPNLFTNTRPVWHPPGARGVYGGAVIAQCLAAAQRTVPENFTVHSMHCYFVLNGSPDIPIIYHVERVREGRSFCTRTVQARQRGQVIFTTTLSFAREGSGGKETAEHAIPMDVVPQPEELAEETGLSPTRPFISRRMPTLNADSPNPHDKVTRQWIKAHGRISDNGGHEAHLSAVAYMSDSYFIGTVARVHNLWRFSSDKIKVVGDKVSPLGITPEALEQLKNMDDETLARIEGIDEQVISQLRAVQIKDGQLVYHQEPRPEIGMMVSLDHTIYFHNQRDFRADEWMYTETYSPWAGSGRGLVMGRIYSRGGKLIATCVQEGVVRLRQQSNL